MRAWGGVATSSLLAVCLRACAPPPVDAPAPTSTPTSTPAPTASAATSEDPAKEALRAYLGKLRKQRGVAGARLSPDGDAFVVRLCAREAAITLDETGAPLPIVIELEENPRDEASGCGCVGNGTYFEIGEAMPSANDGCNRCWCNARGSMACTLLGCKIEILARPQFAPNSAKLEQKDRDLLDAVVKVLKESVPNRRMKIVGHTSKNERAKLSEARARAVRDYLVKAGIDAARLDVVGVGATRPISNDDAALERRVDFELVETN